MFGVQTIVFRKELVDAIEGCLNSNRDRIVETFVCIWQDEYLCGDYVKSQAGDLLRLVHRIWLLREMYGRGVWEKLQQEGF